MTTYIEQHLIDPNPYQPRLDMEPVALNRLAEDIKINGLLQAPAVRPIMGGRYQLIFGHRRAAAWRIAHGDTSPLPCEIRDMDDRQMFAAAIVENDDRESLNAIERAKALQLYMTKFDSTQAAAAQLFGLKDQASVSNLLRLLRLPSGVQTHIATGDLPERYAREMIAFVNIVPEKSLIALADKIAAAETPADAQSYLNMGLDELVRKHAYLLNTVTFDHEWNPGQSDVIIGACDGCKHIAKRRYYEYCGKSSCFEAKSTLHANVAAGKVSADHGIPLADSADYKPLIGGKSRIAIDETLLKAALKKKHPAVRVLPVPAHTEDDQNARYWRNRILGSGEVDLVLRSDVTLKQLYTDLKVKPPAAPETPTAPKSDKLDAVENERLQAEYERIINGTNQTIAAILPHFRSCLQSIPPVLIEIYDELSYGVQEWMSDESFEVLHQSVRKATAKQNQLVDAIIGQCLWRRALDKTPSWYKQFDPKQFAAVRDALADFAHQCKVKLPAGWDARLAPSPAPAGEGRGGGKSKPAKKGTKQ